MNGGVISEKMISELKRLASQELPLDDPHCIIMDVCGGNYDDAYQVGEDEGRREIARDILDDLGIGWKE